MPKLRPASPRSFTFAAAILALLGGFAPHARSSTVYAGTRGEPFGAPAQVLRWEGGTTWTDLSVGTTFRDVWDLEWHDGALWACGQLSAGGAFVARWDGASWQQWSLGSASVATALASADGNLYVGAPGRGLLRLDGATWNLVGTPSPIARMQGDECGRHEPLVFMGGNVFDDFWVFDPTGGLACGESCPSSGASGTICPAGCYGGSCIHSMAWHDDGVEATVYAGAYSGVTFRWSWTNNRFERFASVGSGNVQALASHRGRLHAGTSSSRLVAWTSGSWQHLALFSNDEPISALADDPDEDLLWIGHGGVPFGFARGTGQSMIRTWNGVLFEDRGVPGQFGGGVPALLVVQEDPGIECDAGAPQVVECAGGLTAVTLQGSGSASSNCSAASADLTWSGGFVEGTATGTRPVVHFAAPGTYPISLEVGSGSSIVACETTVTVVDSLPPRITAPPSITIACDELEPPSGGSADDACDFTPELVVDESIVAGPCPQSWTLVRTYTATDAAGNVTVVTRQVDVVDAEPPSLAGLPEEITVPCPGVPAPPAVTASDACDPDIPVLLDERRIAGPCAGTYDLVRTWSASDDCGNAVSATRTVHVVDGVAPSLSGVPADARVACDAVPAPATPSSSDDCDPSPSLAFAEAREDGPCPHSYRLLRTWTTQDDCGNVVSATQALDVLDAQAPRLVGVPADVVVECPAVPPVAAVTAEDGCDAAPVVRFDETRLDGRCAGEYRLLRTWTATDACGNASSATQVVQVVDTTPPAVTPGGDDLGVLWPPNHEMVTFDRDGFSVEASDACSGPVTWRLAGCASDQPENDLGDGNTAPDCEVAPDGSSFAVRAERQGTEPAGRRYAVSVVATDACDNESAPTVIGFIRVPHDQRDRER